MLRSACAPRKRTRDRCASCSEQVEHPLGRSSDHGAAPAHEDRSLDQHGVRRHGAQDRIVARAGVEPCFRECVLALAHPRRDGPSEPAREVAELVERERLLEIAALVERDAARLEQRGLWSSTIAASLFGKSGIAGFLLGAARWFGPQRSVIFAR